MTTETTVAEIVPADKPLMEPLPAPNKRAILHRQLGWYMGLIARHEARIGEPVPDYSTLDQAAYDAGIRQTLADYHYIVGLLQTALTAERES